MTFLLKPKRLYQYTSIHNREVLNVPNPYPWNLYAIDQWKWHAKTQLMMPRHVTWLATQMVFMPIQSRLSGNDRWTKIFVGTDMGWIKINYNDSCVIFKELKEESDVA